MNIQKTVSQAVKDFRVHLENNRSEMDATRETMSDIEFAKIYGVSSMTIVNYMGQKNRYEKAMSRFNVEEINKLRLTKDDAEIGKMYGCSASTIYKKCGPKTALGVPKKKPGYRVESVTSITRRLEIESRVIRKEDRWEYPEVKPYWEVDNAVQLFQGPHKFLYQKLG